MKAQQEEIRQRQPNRCYCEICWPNVSVDPQAMENEQEGDETAVPAQAGAESVAFAI